MDPDNFVSGVLFFSHQSILQRVVRTALEKQLDPKGPNASRGGISTRISKETYSHVIFQVWRVQTPLLIGASKFQLLLLINSFHSGQL